MNNLFKNNRIIGISLLVSLYILSGINKINDFNNVSEGLKSKFENKFPVDLPILFYKFTLILVILLLIGGSLLLIILDQLDFNYKEIILKLLSLLFILFTLFATYLYHFPATGHDYYAALKNISIVGGFLLI